jgi:hypothetical protein
MKFEKYLVVGEFHVHFEKYVTASNEKEAMRKARDGFLKNNKLKAKHFDKNNYSVYNLTRINKKLLRS